MGSLTIFLKEHCSDSLLTNTFEYFCKLVKFEKYKERSFFFVIYTYLTLFCEFVELKGKRRETLNSNIELFRIIKD